MTLSVLWACLLFLIKSGGAARESATTSVVLEIRAIGSLPDKPMRNATLGCAKNGVKVLEGSTRSYVTAA